MEYGRNIIVIPTYNESENIEPLANEIFQFIDTDILFVDDNSPDGTGDKAEALARADDRIHVIHREVKEGLGRAYLDGFKWALARDYSTIMEMDADFSHQPAHLPDFIREIKEYDVVLGSRNISGGGTQNWGVSRKLISKAGNIYARAWLMIDVKDLTGGFKCFRREVLEAIDLDGVKSNGYGFQIELTYRAIVKGFRVKEIPILFFDRRVGESKMSGEIVKEAALLVPWLRIQAFMGKL